MQSSFLSILKRPMAVMLFGLSFMLLQLCMVQMSVQTFNYDHQEVAALQVAEHTAPPHQKTEQPQHHSNGNNVCAVNGCMTPLPQPLAMTTPASFKRANIALPQKSLHGLPPALSERPPKSVFA